MRRLMPVIGILGLVATFTVAPASAQSIHLEPELTTEQFRDFTAELGSVLWSRQFGDATLLQRSEVNIGVQVATTPTDVSTDAWTNTISSGDHRVGRFLSFPRVAARFGVNDRVDIGAVGGFAPDGNYGLGGVDARFALVKQGPSVPVSVLVRPSVTLLFAPSEVLVGTLGIDVSVSRAWGPLMPYAGLGATTSGALELSNSVNLDPVDAGAPVAYAGLSYRWHALVVSGQVEKLRRVHYTFGVGTRF